MGKDPVARFFGGNVALSPSGIFRLFPLVAEGRPRFIGSCDSFDAQSAKATRALN